jgi:NAD(P)-dependent dehydrogenase (short-subunit alcohol dehydrogenase family)
MSEQTGAERVLLVGSGARAEAIEARLASDGYAVEAFASDVAAPDLEAAGKAGGDPYALVIVVPEAYPPSSEGWGAEWCLAVAEVVRQAFLQTKALSRQIMKARRGRIVYVAGSCALSGDTTNEGWAVASGGIAGMARSVARELAGRSVTVNTIACGAADDEAAPLGRPVSEEEVAHACSYLLSPAAGTVTGQVLTVDAGRVMR